MIQKFISNNKSKIAIITSILIHSLILLTFKSDKYLGTTNTPIEFTEIKIISGAGESIKERKSSKVVKKENKKIEKTKSQRSNMKKSTNLISSINNKSKINKQDIQAKEKKKRQTQAKVQERNKELANSKIESIVGDNSKELADEPLKGKLKGKGNKEIICKECKEPFYSQKSIRKGIQGITTVKVTINKNGIVENAIIIRSSGYKEIDNASIQAALESTFKPIIDKSTINITYTHKIKNYR